MLVGMRSLWIAYFTYHFRESFGYVLGYQSKVRRNYGVLSKRKVLCTVCLSFVSAGSLRKRKGWRS